VSVDGDWVALSHEIDATSTLFRHGFAILREYTFASRDAEAVFVCLAGGAEKFLKLTVGVVAVDEGRGWPAKATLKKAGHRITELDDGVRETIARRAQLSSAPGLIANLLAATAADAGVKQALTTLERYATNGRFHNLDRLGGEATSDESPHDLWEELQQMVLEANPEVLEQLAGAGHREARIGINEILATSIGGWCELIRRSWITGVCGDQAQQWSYQLDLGHEAPVSGRLRTCRSAHGDSTSG
jgi:hypothetical protein